MARRTAFENRDDVGYFLSRPARVHRKGLLEIHGFCFLTTHFHLIVRSPVGKLPRAMQETINTFVRWFNRRRKRDGALFRGRFGSRRVQSQAYLTRLVPYVDQNSIGARLASHSGLYPYGSARLFQQGRSPKWHTRGLIERLACAMSGLPQFTPSVYRASFGAELTPAESEWLELRIRCPRDGPDPLDDLVGAAPQRVREWMVRKARLADGTRPGLPLLAPSTVMEVLREEQLREPDLQFRLRRDSRPAWPLLAAGFLRDACGLTIAAAARSLNRPASSVSVSASAHRDLLLADPAYATLAAELLAEALDRLHGPATARIREGGPVPG